MGKLIVVLLLVLCLGAALDAKRARRRKEGKQRAGPEKSRQRSPWRKGDLALPRGPPAKWVQNCAVVEPMINQANQTLHQYKAKLHKLFIGIIDHAQKGGGIGKKKTSAYRTMLHKELGMAVEHQCHNAVHMIQLVKKCNHTGLDYFVKTWHAHYLDIYKRINRIANKTYKYRNGTDLCSAALRAGPRGLHDRKSRFTPQVRHKCQRLELIECIFKKLDMPLPPTGNVPPSRPPRPRCDRLPRRKSRMKKWKKMCKPIVVVGSKDTQVVVGSKGTQVTDAPQSHGKKHGPMKIVAGVFALLLLSACVFLIFFYVRRQRRTIRRLKKEKVAQNEKVVWTTPPDSTVAYLQAKGWRNPVYYVLEDEAMNTCPKVDI